MILVTGASGAIGSRLVGRLVRDGAAVRGLVLFGDPFVSRIDGLAGVTVHHGDVTRPETLEGLFDGVETVYHLAAVLLSPDPEVFERVNVGGTRNVVEAAARAGVAHFVHVSSASVVYPRSTPYSRSKREAERIVREAFGDRATVLRPTLVYEEHGAEEFLIFADHLRRSWIVPLVGRGGARKSPVYVEDLADGMAAVAARPELTGGKTYALCGGEELSLTELARLMLEQDRRRRLLVPVPAWLCRAGIGVLRAAGVSRWLPLIEHTVAGLTQDANLDAAPARRDLGYDPLGVREGLARCFPDGIPRRSR